MYKKYYSQLLTANPQIQNYLSHTHHYWPDVAIEATLQYQKDPAKDVEKVTSVQKLIAEVLNLSRPEKIIFSPDIHELVNKLMKGLEPKKTISVLTTDSEFYNFDFQVEKVTTHPFDDFESRFIKKISDNHYDMIFLSQVFFNSGMVNKGFEKIVASVKDTNTIIVVDGFHGFMAIPTDLLEIEDRIFYIGGFSQSGDGCVFMAGPTDSTLISNSSMDFSSLYRLEAVLSLFKKDGVTVDKIHSYVQKLQNNFRNHLLEIDHHYLTEKNILSVDYNHHGDFLTFVLPSIEQVKLLHDKLRERNIWTDFTGSRLRFGFGIYQNDCIDLKSIN